MFDTSKIERISPDYWRNSQLSLARHYGAIVIHGTRYILDTVTDELVREDVYKASKKLARRFKKVREEEKQQGLF